MKTKKRAGPDLVDEVVAGFAAELPTIDSVALETVSRIIVAGKGFEQQAAKQLKRYGFNYTDFDVLGMLRSSGPTYELTPADLIRFTLITSGAMTTCLDRLESYGMIARRVSDADRRVRLISLTQKGRKVIEKALAERYENARRALAPLSARDIRALNDALRRLDFTEEESDSE